MAADRVERNNLAASRPDLVKTLAAEWDAWAKRANVDPWIGARRLPWGDDARRDAPGGPGEVRRGRPRIRRRGLIRRFTRGAAPCRGWCWPRPAPPRHHLTPRTPQRGPRGARSAPGQRHRRLRGQRNVHRRRHPARTTCRSTRRRTARRRRESSRCRSTSSRRRISTRTAASGPTGATTGATPPSVSSRSGAPTRCRSSATIRRARRPGGSAIATIRAKRSSARTRFTTAKEHYAALLQEARGRGGPTDPHAGDAARLERPLSAPAGENRHLVPRRHSPDPDLSVAAHAGVPEAVRPADVSLLGQQRGAVAGLVLLAGRVHAPIRAVRRRARQSRDDAGAHARHSQRGQDARHANPHRPRVQRGGRRPAARARRAAVVRRDDRVLGRRSADHLDVEHPGLDLARRVRVQQQAPVDRDLHAAQGRRGQADRHQAGDGAVRSGGVRRSRCASCRTSTGSATPTRAIRF